MVCCETYKFTERVHLDSICFNQLGMFLSIVLLVLPHLLSLIANYIFFFHTGDPDELPNTTDPTSPNPTNLPLVTLPPASGASASASSASSASSAGASGANLVSPLTALKDWRSIENLKLLNLLYDLTPIECILSFLFLFLFLFYLKILLRLPLNGDTGKILLWLLQKWE